MLDLARVVYHNIGCPGYAGSLAMVEKVELVQYPQLKDVGRQEAGRGGAFFTQ